MQTNPTKNNFNAVDYIDICHEGSDPVPVVSFSVLPVSFPDMSNPNPINVTCDDLTAMDLTGSSNPTQSVAVERISANAQPPLSLELGDIHGDWSETAWLDPVDSEGFDFKVFLPPAGYEFQFAELETETTNYLVPEDGGHSPLPINVDPSPARNEAKMAPAPPIRKVKRGARKKQRRALTPERVTVDPNAKILNSKEFQAWKRVMESNPEAIACDINTILSEQWGVVKSAVRGRVKKWQAEISNPSADLKELFDRYATVREARVKSFKRIMRENPEMSGSKIDQKLAECWKIGAKAARHKVMGWIAEDQEDSEMQAFLQKYREINPIRVRKPRLEVAKKETAPAAPARGRIHAFTGPIKDSNAEILESDEFKLWKQTMESNPYEQTSEINKILANGWGISPSNVRSRVTLWNVAIANSEDPDLVALFNRYNLTLRESQARDFRRIMLENPDMSVDQIHTELAKLWKVVIPSVRLKLLDWFKTNREKDSEMQVLLQKYSDLKALESQSTFKSISFFKSVMDANPGAGQHEIDKVLAKEWKIRCSSIKGKIIKWSTLIKDTEIQPLIQKYLNAV
ncbi:MAG: hypothetical protein Q8K75_11535 [Chlamydiales bacterium]|nr:hypothetical protein [Chlamydiales bacterium]